MKLFIVEDSPIIRERLLALLGDIDRVEVVGIADNAAEAIDRIARLKPDAVVLDIKLRGAGNGIGVLREIRRRDAAKTTIMLTNHADVGVRQLCLDIGATHFFDKTGEFEKVRDVLAAWRPDDAVRQALA